MVTIVQDIPTTRTLQISAGAVPAPSSATNRIACVIPFTGGDQTRQDNYLVTLNYWRQFFPVYVTDRASSIGEARNRAAYRALEAGHEFLFFVDADILFKPENVKLATEVAILTGSSVYPYGLLTRLYQSEEKEILKGNWPQQRSGHAEAGALVISSENFIKVCGFPQISWAEDALFHNVCQSFLGPITRVWEPAFHLYHQPSSPNWDLRLTQIVRASEEAVTDPEMMKLLIERSNYYDIDTFEKLGYIR